MAALSVLASCVSPAIDSTAAAPAPRASTYTNPLLPSGPDPWITQVDGIYYYTHTMGDRITLWRTNNIANLADAQNVVAWTPPKTGPNAHSIWAPELHRVDGKWFLYYSATASGFKDDAHRAVFVLENDAADPMNGNWVERGRVNTAYAGIDGTVFSHGGKRYFVYSPYIGPDSALAIAQMKNPWTLMGRESVIARPDQPWERQGGRQIVEGPEFLLGPKNDLFLTYSASACWSDDYSLGLLHAPPGADPLDASAWSKSPQPVLKRANDVYATGHNGFFLSPDSKENWIIYHANPGPGMECTLKRAPHIQRFGWTEDGWPKFGEPVAKGTPLPVPSSSPAPLWSAQPTVSIDVQERTFKNGAVDFSGTLHTPQVKGRVPAVIIFHAASSPTRDFPLYRHVVEMLPPLGVAVFVFDRRGSGKSGGKLEDSDYAMLADDGIAAQRMLADDPRIDPRRIGFWGLSQGGWLALLAASRSSQTAFAISISAPMTTPDIQMNFAVANILRIKGFPGADIDRAIATRTAVDDFMRGKRDRASTQAILDAAVAEPWFEHIYMGKTFKDPEQSRWAKEMRHDPLATLDAVKAPALVIYGSADPWVPAQTSVERLRASAARRSHIEVAVITGADHAMATSVSAADQIDPVLSAKEAPESPEYFGLLGAWLVKQDIARVP